MSRRSIQRGLRNHTPRPDERNRVTGADLLTAAQGQPQIDVEQFFADIDRVVDPDPLRGPGER